MGKEGLATGTRRPLTLALSLQGEGIGGDGGARLSGTALQDESCSFAAGRLAGSVVEAGGCNRRSLYEDET